MVSAVISIVIAVSPLNVPWLNVPVCVPINSVGIVTDGSGSSPPGS